MEWFWKNFPKISDTLGGSAFETKNTSSELWETFLMPLIGWKYKLNKQKGYKQSILETEKPQMAALAKIGCKIEYFLDQIQFFKL